MIGKWSICVSISIRARHIPLLATSLKTKRRRLCRNEEYVSGFIRLAAVYRTVK